MRPLILSVPILLLAVGFLGACAAGAPEAAATPAPQALPTSAPEAAPTAASEATATPGAGQSTYGDPFAYCAAVGIVDAPDARYNGPAMPDAIVQGMIEQGIVTADAPPDFQKNAVWRCMDGQVWVCHFGANLPCQEKADTSQVPSAAMQEFCKANPAADVLPAAVTGRATVYEWKCTDGQPEVLRQLFQSDPQGYLAAFWYELAPQ
jgi:hypothetical protein